MSAGRMAWLWVTYLPESFFYELNISVGDKVSRLRVILSFALQSEKNDNIISDGKNELFRPINLFDRWL